LRLYWEISRRSVRRQLTYRAAIVAGLVTNVFFGLVRAAIMGGLYGGRGSVEGMSLAQAVSYTGITQALAVGLAVFGWYDLMAAVYRGDVASDLLKPVSLYGFWMAQDLGRALVQLAARGGVILVVYALTLGLVTPRDAAGWLAFALSVLLGWVLSFAFRFAVNLAAFWSPDARGIGRSFFVLALFSCGLIMPVRLYPDWLRAVLAATPFPHMLNTPAEVFLGTIQGGEVLPALLAQLGWALALVVFCQWLYGRAVRRLVIQGG